MEEKSKPLEKVKDEVPNIESQLEKISDMLGKVLLLERTGNELLVKIRLDIYRIRAAVWAVGGLLLIVFFMLWIKSC